MALKFRRGTTAQQSGSLAYGEPYVNTTLGTLLIGGPDGDIVLGTSGTGSTGNFGAISGSGLDITGNANIAGNLTLGGNITIGDATTDNVVINADLSSSLIPNDDNAFDIGSTSKRYRNIYGNQISGSQLLIQSGSNPQIRLINDTTGIEYHIQNGNAGNFQIHREVDGVDANLFLFESSSLADGNPDAYFYSNLFISESLHAASVFTSQVAANALTGSLSGSVSGIGNVSVYSSSVASKFTELGIYTASVDGRFTTLATLTGSNGTRLTALETSASTALSTNNTQATSITNLNTTTASLNTSVSNLNTFSASENGKAATLATYTGSVEGRFATLATLTGSNGTRLTALEVSASTALSTNNTQATSITNLNSTTASLNTSVTNLNTFSASENGKAATLATYTGSNDTKWSTLGSLSGSFARTNSNNTFSGLQSFNNINVEGTASFAYIQSTTGSSTSIGEAFIILNENTPSSNFAGIKVVDSGSSFTTASFVYDGLNNNWVFEKANVGSSDTSLAIFGPISTGGLGTEVGLTQNKLPKAVSSHGHHIADSQISDDGTTVSIGGALTVTGNITGPIRATNGVVSGSSQITYSGLSGIPAGIVSGSSQITSILPAGVVSGSSQVIGILSSLNTYTGSNDTTNTTQNTRLTALEASASTALSTNNSQGVSVTNLNTFSGSALTRLTALEVAEANLETFSASALTRLSTLEGKDISITLTGDVTGTGTITDLANVSFATTIAANSVALGTDTTGNYMSGVTAGTGITISHTPGEGSNATITNSDRGSSQNIFKNIAVSGQSTVIADGNDDTLTLVAGSNVTITTNASTDTITIASTDTNTITTNIAGTGVSVSSGTGNSTISIGQSVATSANAQFNSLGIGMAASATAGRIDATNDIVAFSSSDIRFKENIKPIENALDKIRKISGNTYDWKAENKAEHGYEGNDVGVIAQEIEAVLPQLVQTRENGYKAVKYDKLVALLIEGIKDQQLQIEQLRIDLNNCRNKGL
jgi:hypothetical protein